MIAFLIMVSDSYFGLSHLGYEKSYHFRWKLFFWRTFIDSFRLFVIASCQPRSCSSDYQRRPWRGLKSNLGGCLWVTFELGWLLIELVATGCPQALICLRCSSCLIEWCLSNSRCSNGYSGGLITMIRPLIIAQPSSRKAITFSWRGLCPAWFWYQNAPDRELNLCKASLIGIGFGEKNSFLTRSSGRPNYEKGALDHPFLPGPTYYIWNSWR